MQQEKARNPNEANDVSVSKLTEYLRTELCAMETYEVALAHIDHVGLHHELQRILASHASRADAIIERLLNRGAQPVQSSGAWGALSRLVQSGADLLGNRAALIALEDGEERCLRIYQQDLPGVDAGVKGLVRERLLPAQHETRELCRSLRAGMMAS